MTDESPKPDPEAVKVLEEVRDGYLAMGHSEMKKGNAPSASRCFAVAGLAGVMIMWLEGVIV